LFSKYLIDNIQLHIVHVKIQELLEDFAINVFPLILVINVTPLFVKVDVETENA